MAKEFPKDFDQFFNEIYDRVWERHKKRMEEEERFRKMSLKEKKEYLERKIDEVLKDCKRVLAMHEMEQQRKKQEEERRKQEKFERWYQEYVKRYGTRL